MARKHEAISDQFVCWPRSSWATGINNEGAVIGCRAKKRHITGFAWSAAHGLVELEHTALAMDSDWWSGCAPISISNNGAIVGITPGFSGVLLWNLKGEVTAKINSDVVELKKVTDDGHVLWWSKLPSLASCSRVWRDGHTLDLPFVEGGSDAEACDVNNCGEVVGVARVPGGRSKRLPCLWTSDGEVHNLNALISEREVILDRPRAINDSGWIACNGAYRGRYGTPFVLEPMPQQQM